MRTVKFLTAAVFAAAALLCSADWGGGFELEKGEELAYSVKFLSVIPVGTVSIETKDIVTYNGKSAFLITSAARTAKWLSLFFKAEATVNSYADTRGLYPYKFEQVLKIAGKPDDIRRATYDRANNIMDAEGKGKKKVPADVRDPISAIYFLRAQELKEGDEIKQMVNNNQSTYIFDSRVIGKKKIGRYNCWVLEAKIRRENKTMYHSMDAVIYISDDGRRLPVLIEARTQAGPVTLRLK